MKVYVHDGSMEGLLTALAQSFVAGDGPADVVAGEAWSPSLFDEPVWVKTDDAAADVFLDRVEKGISPEAVHRTFHCYQSELGGVEGPLREYLRLGFEKGAAVEEFVANKAVRRVQEISRKVMGEAHRLKGLLRFRELAKGWLWAPMEPDHNVALAVALHFRGRLGGERWLIHDLRRAFAVQWRGDDLSVLAGDVLQELVNTIRPEQLSRPEQEYQELWRAFHRAVAIPERRNLSLQRQNMPRRYWRHLVEK